MKQVKAKGKARIKEGKEKVNINVLSIFKSWKQRLV